MDFGKLRLPAALVLICVASFVTFLQVKANEETDDPVGPAAIWSPDADDLSDIAQSCNAEPDYGRCFLDQMENFASSEAVEFSQSLLEQTPSGAGYLRVGYLKDVREAGTVDLGLVAYPRAGGPSQGWVLLNGAPPIINVDDLSRLPQSEMEKDPQFNALRKIYPEIKLSVDAGERQEGAMPEVRSLDNGKQRFVIGYSLDACSTCPAIAHASFGFDFDASGKFMSARFLQVSAQKQ
jgi:hypothetical protein